MKKDFMRWAVGLLAGGALVVAGCGGSGNKSGEGERETGAFRTPTQERQQPSSDDEAKPLASERPSHPAVGDQDTPGGNLPRGTPLGGGTAGPNTSMRQEAAGLLPRGNVGTGLGANLADVYQAPQPQGDTATGGAGTEGQTQAVAAARVPARAARRVAVPVALARGRTTGPSRAAPAATRAASEPTPGVRPQRDGARGAKRRAPEGASAVSMGSP
jgi:hypothetical protein